MSDKSQSLLTVQIPVEIHKALKVRAAEKGTTMKTLLLDLIKRELADK